MKFEKFSVLSFFCKSLLVPQNARPCFEPVRKGSGSADARTRQKLPVASFGVSETAETGSIVSGREQDDHVSRSRLRPATSVQNPCGGIIDKI